MILRIQFPKGGQVRRQPGRNRQVALAASSLLGPISLMAYVLGFWRLASDVGVASDSGLTGILSHWQTWIGLGVGMHITSRMLARYGNGAEFTLPMLHVLRTRTARRGPSGPY
ncbi:MAG: hypothetical protein ABI811_00760 [Acidobacteriota bacterium]